MQEETACQVKAEDYDKPEGAGEEDGDDDDDHDQVRSPLRITPHPGGRPAGRH